MTDDDDLYAHNGDATDLTAEERVGLIPTWIVTRDDLNRAERANITDGLRWARRGRFDVLNPEALMTLHKRMYGDVIDDPLADHRILVMKQPIGVVAAIRTAF